MDDNIHSHFVNQMKVTMLVTVLGTMAGKQNNKRDVSNKEAMA